MQRRRPSPSRSSRPRAGAPRCFGGSHFLPGIGDAQCHLNNEIPQRCSGPPRFCLVHGCFFCMYDRERSGKVRVGIRR